MIEGDGQGSLLAEGSAATKATSKPTDDAAGLADPRGERNRMWSVEVLLKSGRSERETVKAVSRDAAFRYISQNGEYGTDAILVIEGVNALVRISHSEIAMIRVSKGA